MTDAQEKRLIEALRKVDAHGDVAPAHVQDPMIMVLRQRAIQADLMRWDDSRGHYVLTGTGPQPNQRAEPRPWRRRTLQDTKRQR
jgi:hypothetical protein